MGQMLLIFNPDGSVTKETRGFKGKSCTKATEFMDKALGSAGPRKYKTEYYNETEKIKNKNTQ